MIDTYFEKPSQSFIAWCKKNYGTGGWDFDPTKIKHIKSVDKRSISSYFASFQLLPYEKTWVAITSGGYYYRVGTISDFDPSTIECIKLSSSGKYWQNYLYTADGLRWFGATGGYATSYGGLYYSDVQTKFDINSLPTE